MHDDCLRSASRQPAGPHHSSLAPSGLAVRGRRGGKLQLGFAAALILVGLSIQSAAQQRIETPDPAGTMQRIEIDVNGEIREALVYLPDSAGPAASRPIVLDLHASGIAPETEARLTGMGDAADSHGFLVVLPQARKPFPSGGTSWNIPYMGDGDEEVAFIESLLVRLDASYGIDRERVFVVGFSGGARLASHLACRIPEQIAAIGVVGGLRAPATDSENCAGTDRPVRILAFHSEDDPVNPFRGDAHAAPAYWTHGVDDAFAWWSQRYECDSAETDMVGARIVRMSASRCIEGAAVRLYLLAESGHTWPGSAFPFPERLGKTERELDATRIILGWFGLIPAGRNEEAYLDFDG